MPSINTALLGLLASAPAVLGHGHVREVIANGVKYPGYERWNNRQDEAKLVTWKFSTEDEGPVPVSKLGHPDIICHQNGENAAASIPVSSGDEIKVRRFNDIGGFEHPGPEMHYLASCGDGPCSKVDKSSLRFYKFYEKGLVRGGLPDNQVWATTEVHDNVERVDDGFIDEFTVKIPEGIPSGNYVLRHELLGLHMAHEGKAEFYPQCINLEVKGSGSSLPEGRPATELYSANDPGIDLDIWVNLKSYEIPGPAVTSSKKTTGTRSSSHPRDFKLEN